MSLNFQTLQVGAGLINDETSFKVGQFGYTDLNNVRPHRGELEVIGGWERNSTNTLTGKCRGQHSWKDNSGNVNTAFGTHEKLYVLVGGALVDITPADFVAGNENGFGGGGYGVGGYGLNGYGQPTEGINFPLTWSLDNYGEWLIANPRGGKIYVWKNDTSAVAVELAGRTTIYDSDFTSYADQTAFDADYTRGTGWTFDAANDEADCDGTQTGSSDLEYTVTGLTVGERYRVECVYTRSAGSISALGASSVGASQSEVSGTAAVVFIATATSATIAARADVDFIGTVTGVTVEQMGAPEIVECILVTASRQIVAYGCDEEVGVTQNPRCVRWCDIENVSEWTTKNDNNAGEQILRNAGRLVRAMEIGQIIGVWTDSGMIWQSFLGLPESTWAFEPAGRNCGLVGPNGVAVLGTSAYWCSPDFVFYSVTYGGEPLAIPSPVDKTFKDAQAASQQEKIYASTVAKFNEVWWFYPHDDDGVENSRYVAMSVAEGGNWFEGNIGRTSYEDASPSGFPVATDGDGKIWLHERGNEADGAGIPWHAETGDIYFSNSGALSQVIGIRPDVKDQGAPINLTIKGRAYPQSQATDADYVEISELLAVNQKKADFRISAAIVNVRWSGSLLGATCRFGSPVFDVQARGRR